MFQVYEGLTISNLAFGVIKKFSDPSMDGLPRSVYIDGFVGQSQQSESGDSLPALNPYLYHRTLDSVIPLQKYEDLEVQAEVYNIIIESNRENLALKQDIFLFDKKEN